MPDVKPESKDCGKTTDCTTTYKKGAGSGISLILGTEECFGFGQVDTPGTTKVYNQDFDTYSGLGLSRAEMGATGKSGRCYSSFETGNHSLAVSIGGEFNHGGWPFLLARAFRMAPYAAASIPSPSVYDIANVKASFFIQEHHSDVDAGVQDVFGMGLDVDTMTISVDTATPATIEFGIIGATSAAGDEPSGQGTETDQTGGAVFTHKCGLIQIFDLDESGCKDELLATSDQCELNAFSVTLSNNVTLSNCWGSSIPSDNSTGTADITGSIELYYFDNNMSSFFANDRSIYIEVTVLARDGSSALIQIPNAAISALDSPYNEEALIQTLSFRALCPICAADTNVSSFRLTTSTSNLMPIATETLFVHPLASETIAASIGAEVCMSVEPSSGSLPCTYQWFKGAIPIQNEKGSTYSFIASGSNGGSYTCKITNTVSGSVVVKPSEALVVSTS